MTVPTMYTEPRIGDNKPPEPIDHTDATSLPAIISGIEGLPAAVNDYANAAYRETISTIDALLEEGRAMPLAIEDGDDSTAGRFSVLIKRLRDEGKRLAAFHEHEKSPYFRAAQAWDQFFFGLIDKVARRDRKNQPGMADVLQGRLDHFLQRKLAAEQAKLRAEAERRERERREAERIAREAAAKAEADRLAADRARKAETQAAKGAVAEQSAQVAFSAGVHADVATERAQEAAQIAQTAKPSDLVRQRVAEGPLVTMRQEPYAEIMDETALDKDRLWPFISFAAKEQALRAWARSTGHKAEMPGAQVGFRSRGQVR